MKCVAEWRGGGTYKNLIQIHFFFIKVFSSSLMLLNKSQIARHDHGNQAAIIFSSALFQRLSFSADSCYLIENWGKNVSCGSRFSAADVCLWYRRFPGFQSLLLIIHLFLLEDLDRIMYTSSWSIKAREISHSILLCHQSNPIGKTAEFDGIMEGADKWLSGVIQWLYYIYSCNSSLADYNIGSYNACTVISACILPMWISATFCFILQFAAIFMFNDIGGRDFRILEKYYQEKFILSKGQKRCEKWGNILCTDGSYAYAKYHIIIHYT